MIIMYSADGKNIDWSIRLDDDLKLGLRFAILNRSHTLRYLRSIYGMRFYGVTVQKSSCCMVLIRQTVILEFFLKAISDRALEC